MKSAANPAVRTRFAGWPKPALQFFDGLKRDNSKAYFEAHRQVYEEQVRQPMEALLAEIERDLGPDIEVKIFRLNRDLRFTPDKRPYKEHLGAYLSTAGAGGLYLQISDDGLYLAVGSHEMAPDQLNRFRDAVAGKDGEKLARIVAALVKEGYQVTEPSFKRVPPLRGRSPTRRPPALQGADGQPQLEARGLAADGRGERPGPAGDQGQQAAHRLARHASRTQPPTRAADALNGAGVTQHDRATR